MTIAQIIDNGKDSEFTSIVAQIKGGLFGGGLYKANPLHIYCVRKSVEWLYDLDPDDDTLTATSNYLQAISIMYWIPKANANGAAGSGVAPVVTGNILPQPYDFEVTGSSYIIAGQSQKTINAFIGYNITFDRNNVPQSQVNMGGSYFSWNPNTGNFQVFPEAATSELFTITPV